MVGLVPASPAKLARREWHHHFEVAGLVVPAPPVEAVLVVLVGTAGLVVLGLAQQRERQRLAVTVVVMVQVAEEAEPGEAEAGKVVMAVVGISS